MTRILIGAACIGLAIVVFSFAQALREHQLIQREREKIRRRYLDTSARVTPIHSRCRRSRRYR
jgi:hypothetical protein